MENKIIKNSTQGYGYSYASLGDIASQGISIPKMETRTEANGKDYIYWYDTDLREWHRGAEIVIPQAKGMNTAQIYASAITYARRVTTHLATGIATADDQNIENIDETGDVKEEKPQPIPQTTIEEIHNQINQMIAETGTDAQKLTAYFGVDKVEALNRKQCNEALEMLKVKRGDK